MLQHMGARIPEGLLTYSGSMAYEYLPAPKPPNRQGLSYPRLFREDPAEARERIPAQDRWPRGYDPERRDDIRAGLHITPSDRGIANNVFNLANQDAQPHDAVQATRRGVIDALARSKAPVEDILEPRQLQNAAGLRTTMQRPSVVVHSHPGWFGGHVSTDDSGGSDELRQEIYLNTPTAAAQLAGSPKVPTDEPPTIPKTNPGAERVQHARGERVLLHELGHSVSNRQGNAHSAAQGVFEARVGGRGANTWADSPATRGTEEAFADTYSYRHHKLDRKDESRGLNRSQFHDFNYPAMTYNYEGRKAAQFSEAYERKTAGVRRQAEEERQTDLKDGLKDSFSGLPINEVMDKGFQRIPGVDWFDLEHEAAYHERTGR